MAVREPAPHGSFRPFSATEERRARLLTVTRRRATGLLAVVAVVFALSTAFESDAGWLTWIQATALASMVGGLADWFAVTALFRRPLGLPIPHTAIVVERKDRFAETLGAFVQESFLTPDAVGERLRASRALPRGAAWLADERNAYMLAGRATEGLASAAALLRDADVHDVLHAVVRQRFEYFDLAGSTGRTLERLTRDGRHEPVLSAALRALGRYIQAHGPEIQGILDTQLPWWLPAPLSERMASRLGDRIGEVVSEMADDPEHPLRAHVSQSLDDLARRLQADPELRLRGDELKNDLLAEKTVRQLAATIWNEVKNELRQQAIQPESELRRRLARAISDTGRRLSEDPGMAASAQRSIDAVTKAVLTSFDEELAGLVSGTIARWDTAETAHRLELLLGPDLQYIRINGTVVGALAGLVLHAIAVH